MLWDRLQYGGAEQLPVRAGSEEITNKRLRMYPGSIKELFTLIFRDLFLLQIIQ